MTTLRQIGGGLAKLLGLPRVEGILFPRALVEAGLAEKGLPGTCGGLRSPPATPKQAALLALSMASGVQPKAGVREAQEFYSLTLERGWRAFQNDAGIQSAPIDDFGGTQDAQFGDVLASILAAYWPQ